MCIQQKRTMNIIRTRYHISLFLIVTTLLSIQEMSRALDTIDTSRLFRDNGTTLISAGGTFELGFFTPQNSYNRYVGIWFQNITVRTVVWVANRDDPLMDQSGTLMVVGSGNLVLVNGTNGVVWSTNVSRDVQNPFAQLLDSGNLVVRDANSVDLEDFIWQSFHYPTDTLLPGMNLGWNFATDVEVYLTSWKNRDDPASGEFTYHCDPTGYPQNVLKYRTSVLYRTGPWNGIGFSENSSSSRNILTFGMVMNENEVYYRYELINKAVITRFTLSDGGGQTWVWADRTQSWNTILAIPIDNCDDYNYCGPYGSCSITNSPPCRCLNGFIPRDPQGWERGDSSSGCIRRSPLNCGKDYGFLRYSGIKLPDTKHSWFNTSMLTLDECRVLCSQECSCTAYASLYINGSGCLFWTDELIDIRVMAPGQDIYIRMASSELGRKKRGILIVTLSLVIGIPLLCLSLFLYIRQRKKLDHQRRATGRLRRNYNDENHEDLELPLFDFSQITKATDNFSITKKLGQGGFGPVYKGLLEKGQEIAVKCLSRTSHQGVDEFKNEIICIAKLQHRNLVKLLGWCIHGEEMMLVYEYMPNKSLDLILFDPTKSILLDWSTRFNIINGIARGLMYLHQDSRLRVIHRDLKASNILLDSDMNPKISDFGLARTFGGNETGADTGRIVGTYGYMSPEYAVDGVFSVKSDVFSYGVIVLEIVTGKRNRGFSHTDHLLNLLGHAWVLYKEERSLELVDSCLGNSCYLTQVVRSIHIGLLCVQERPEDRPNMSSVVQMLSNDGVLPEAKNPGFFTARDLVNTENSATPNAAPSTNEMTFSLLEAR